MVRRLVEDMLRRAPVKPLAFLAIGLAVSWGSLPSAGHGSIAVAISMAATYVLGPVLMLDRLRTPLFSYLPVSRRDVWRATWLMSTLAPATLMAATKLPAMLTTSAGIWSSLTLSTVMDLLYAGAGCGLVAAGDTKRIPSQVRWIAAPLLLAGVPLPALVRAWLPMEWSELRSAHLWLFAAALALTAWGAFHTPSVFRAPGFRPRARSSTAVVDARPRGGLSGLPRLIAHELGSSLMLGASILVTFLGMMYVIDGWMGRRSAFHDFLADHLLLVLDSRHVLPVQSRPRELDFVALYGWWGFYAAAVFVRFPQLLRHLRVLPLGRLRLHALFLAWPVLVWSVAWILLALVQRMTIGDPIADYHFPVLFLCVGLSAAGIAMGVRFTWGPSVAAATALPLLMLMVDMSSVWLVAIGVMSFTLAAALNTSSLSRSATYKRIDPIALRTRGA